MFNASDIREHAEVIGSDGGHVGTVDRVEGSRIKLTKADSGAGHEGHHHFIDLELVSAVEDGRVRLSISSQDAMANEEEKSGRSIH
jgi:hypothetical protein